MKKRIHIQVPSLYRGFLRIGRKHGHKVVDLIGPEGIHQFAKCLLVACVQQGERTFLRSLRSPDIRRQNAIRTIHFTQGLGELSTYLPERPQDHDPLRHLTGIGSNKYIRLASHCMDDLFLRPADEPRPEISSE